MNTSINLNNSNSVNNSRVYNYIRAELVTSREGEILWHIYRQQGEDKSDDFYFRNAIKARRYVNILKRKGGGYMPKEDFTALCQAMKDTPRQHFEVTVSDTQGLERSTIVATKVPSDAKRIGLARIARQWGEEAKALDSRIREVLMPAIPDKEPEAPEAPAKKSRRRSKKVSAA